MKKEETKRQKIYRNDYVFAEENNERKPKRNKEKMIIKE